MKCFIINLERDLKKKDHLTTLCEKYGLDYEVIPAVDGKKIGDLFKYYSAKKSIENIRREMTAGEVGTALSHALVYKKIIENNLDFALVFEDDVDFDAKLTTFLAKTDELPDNWEVLLLGHHGAQAREIPTKTSLWGQNNLGKEFKIARPREIGYGAYGYLITRTGAARLSHRLNNIEKPLDWYTGDDREVNLFVLREPIVHINSDLTAESNLESDRKKIELESLDKVPPRKLGLFKRVLFKLGLRRYVKKIGNLYKYIKPLRRYR